MATLDIYLGFRLASQIQYNEDKTSGKRIPYLNHYLFCKCGEWHFVRPETFELTVNGLTHTKCYYCKANLPKVFQREAKELPKGMVFFTELEDAQGRFCFDTTYVPDLNYYGTGSFLRQDSNGERIYKVLYQGRTEIDIKEFVLNIPNSDYSKAKHSNKFFKANGFFWMLENNIEHFWR